MIKKYTKWDKVFSMYQKLNNCDKPQDHSEAEKVIQRVVTAAKNALRNKNLDENGRNAFVSNALKELRVKYTGIDEAQAVKGKREREEELGRIINFIAACEKEMPSFKVIVPGLADGETKPPSRPSVQ